MSTTCAVTDSAILLATFSVNEGMFAIDASRIQEIIRPRAMTRVPHACGAIMGVINLRGRIVTIFDTARLLADGVGAFDTITPGPENRIIIVNSQSEFVGLMVERVTEVLEAEAGTAEPAPANVGTDRALLFSEVYRVHGRVVSLLNTDAVLASEAASRGQRGVTNEPSRPRCG
jgi:purine-binding chemotaxis protein CheW